MARRQPSIHGHHKSTTRPTACLPANLRTVPLRTLGRDKDPSYLFHLLPLPPSRLLSLHIITSPHLSHLTSVLRCFRTRNACRALDQPSHHYSTQISHFSPLKGSSRPGKAKDLHGLIPVHVWHVSPEICFSTRPPFRCFDVALLHRLCRLRAIAVFGVTEAVAHVVDIFF